MSVAVAVGGSGGTGGAVTIANRGLIATLGQDAYGVFAQSVGGGAAGGGVATASGGNLSVAVCVGGKGGAGGDGNTAAVQNSGSIVTRGTDAIGLSVQSVGCGGGKAGKGGATAGGTNGASSAKALFDTLAAGLNFGQKVTDLGNGIPQIGIDGKEIQATAQELQDVFSQPQARAPAKGASVKINVAVAVGGAAGAGGAVNATNTGTITTYGAQSDGVYAQSVGGGGGAAGAATSTTKAANNTPVSGTATDANGTLSGPSLTKTGIGTYALAATTPGALTSELNALVFTPTQAEVAAGQTVTTAFTLAATQNGATTTNSTASVIARALIYVDGPAGGYAVLNGTPGVDVITAHGSHNAIFGKGGADIIDAGAGAAYVDVAGGSATVTLGAGFNAVVGGDGNVTVKGAPDGYTAVTLGNGNNTVQVGGTHDVILLGNGTNLVGGTQGMTFISTGAGNDTIKLGGSGSTVNAGAGTNSITGGSGGDTFVLPKASQGFDGITGFTEANGDVLDLRAALAATSWNHQAATLGNYLKVADSGGSATLAIAPAGSGAGTAIATLTGSGNLGLSDLLSHHSLQTG